MRVMSNGADEGLITSIKLCMPVVPFSENDLVNREEVKTLQSYSQNEICSHSEAGVLMDSSNSGMYHCEELFSQLKSKHSPIRTEVH